MKLSTPGLFVKRAPSVKNLRLTKTTVDFPSYWIAKRDIIITHDYNDDTSVQISIDPRGIFTDISYRGYQYHAMRDLNKSLLKWALSP